MLHYFYVLDREFFHDRMQPDLAASWRYRDFAPCRELCRSLLDAVEQFATRYHTGSDVSIIRSVAAGLTFDREYWKLLVGEIFLVAAADIPEFQSAAEILCRLLSPETADKDYLPRESASLIQQAHFGSRDIRFGPRAYCPDSAGLNDADDVARIETYLARQRPETWQASALKESYPMMHEASLADEIDFAREWFPALRKMYTQARQNRQIVVCEVMG